MSIIKVKVIGSLADEVEEFSAGVSGQSILCELRQGRAGRLKNSAGRIITSDDQNLPAGDYTFEVAANTPSGANTQPGLLAARAAEASRFVGHDEHGLAVTTVGPRHMLTFSHQQHSALKPGDQLMVKVNNPKGSSRVEVRATVLCRSPPMTQGGLDLVWLESDTELEAPCVDRALQAGELYILQGASSTCMVDPASSSHAMVASTCYDMQHFARGDTMSTPGDSGGGCFAVSTGKLFAMNVGNDLNTHKSCLVTIERAIGFAQGCGVNVVVNEGGQPARSTAIGV